jgi:membrane protein DedA with SNARE-associated domain
VFGPVGLIFGAVAKSKGEEKAVVALVVSGLGLVVGMMLGYLVFASM